jgi:DNA-binding response OmpR family regulator
MVNQKPSVLIVDDEPVVCDVLHDELSERGYLCTTVLSGDDALAKLATEDFDVVLLDIRLPGMSGMEVLREIWLNHSDTATIMITAVNDVNTAVLSMKWGASDYLVKPFNLERVNASIRTALETRPTAQKPSEMNAIARGVEAKVDPFSAFSSVVTERTIEIARQLDIAEEEIQRWAAAKAKLDSKRGRASKPEPNKSQN